MRELQIRHVYGLEPEDFDALMMAQSGRCAICSDELTAPNVDHDHATGAVRGLLCRNCNSGLGYFKDDVRALTEAIEYLRSGS